RGCPRVESEVVPVRVLGVGPAGTHWRAGLGERRPRVRDAVEVRHDLAAVVAEGGDSPTAEPQNLCGCGVVPTVGKAWAGASVTGNMPAYLLISTVDRETEEQTVLSPRVDVVLLPHA